MDREYDGLGFSLRRPMAQRQADAIVHDQPVVAEGGRGHDRAQRLKFRRAGKKQHGQHQDGERAQDAGNLRKHQRSRSAGLSPRVS